MRFRLLIIPRLKLLAAVIAVVVAVKSIWMSMMLEDGARVLAGETRAELFARRDYLLERVHAREMTTEDMPSSLGAQFQGEWAVGTYSMVTAAITNLAFIFADTREAGLLVVDELIERMRSTEIRRFDTERWGEDPLESLDGEHGHIGYLGHLNWMIGAHYFLGGDGRYDALFESISGALYRRLKASPGLCLETYPGEIYVPDNVVVFASLANFSRLRGGRFGDLGWVEHAKHSLLDPELGLLPFLLDQRCRPLGGVRGSGAGWNSFYLPYIDPVFASQQFAALKRGFLQTRVITGIREYPKGVVGVGDVDSGPVVFGFSPSGTGFAIAGAVHERESKLLSDLLFTAELVGSSFEWGGRRRYLLAPLVGDSILLAMKTARVWDLRYLSREG